MAEARAFLGRSESSSDDDGALEIFDRASTAAHSCAPNCALEVVRGLRRDDGSVADTLVKGDRVRQAQVGLRLRAVRPIVAGEEITFCYLPDLDLRAEFRDRRRPVWKSTSESGPRIE